MNKKTIIEGIDSEIINYNRFMLSNDKGSTKKLTECVEFLVALKKLIRQLDVIEKPTVPVFVADFYERAEYWEQNEFTDTNWVLKNAFSDTEESKEIAFLEWVKNNPSDYLSLVQAIESGVGYDVEGKKYYGWYYALHNGQKLFVNNHTGKFTTHSFESVEELEKILSTKAQQGYCFTERDKETLPGQWKDWLTWEEV